METEQHLTASDGVSIAYWRWRGRPEPQPVMVLLHGAASNHTRWSEFLDETSLKETRDVLRPDLRGNAASLVRGQLDCEVWSCDLAELLDLEGYDDALIIGHSLGAQIAVNFAHRHPHRARGLVLIDPVFRSALTGRRRLISRMGPLFSAFTWSLRGLNALGLRRRTIDSERDLRALDNTTREALAGGESHAEIARRYSALGPILRQMPVANYVQQLRATLADLPPLEQISAPTLVLLSTGVTFADPDTNRTEISRFPRSEVVEIDANHWPLTEKPAEVRRAIERWAAPSRP